MPDQLAFILSLVQNTFLYVEDLYDEEAVHEYILHNPYEGISEHLKHEQGLREDNEKAKDFNRMQQTVAERAVRDIVVELGVELVKAVPAELVLAVNVFDESSQTYEIGSPLEVSEVSPSN